MTPAVRTGVSVIVLTRNEERNLAACLDSVVGWARQVVVVDSGSTDHTVEIARAHGASVATHSFLNHTSQWRWALESLPLHGEWILGLDADQRVSPELAASIQAAIAQSRSEIQGYFVNRRQIFRGRWIRYGGYYPKYLLKLFRPGAVRLNERDLVDHHFEIVGLTAKLRGDLIEDNQNEADIGEWIAKHTRYARLQAIEEVDKLAHGSRAGRWFGNPDERTASAKRVWLSLPLFVRPFLYFFYRYVLRLGFLDGRQGLIFHFMQALWYRLLVDINREELEAAARAQATSGASGAQAATEPSAEADDSDLPRVLLCAGGMVTYGGAERMTFAALRALQERGARVHCIFNDWAYEEMAAIATRYGMEWSTSAHAVRLNRHSRRPRVIAEQVRDMWRTNRDLWRTARSWRASHVLVPAHDTAVRNAAALLALRACGVRTLMKMSNAPVPTAFYRRLWRWAVSPVMSHFVCNSQFTRQELLACGIPSSKMSLIYETLPDRPESSAVTPKVPGRIVFAGQLIPEKGLHVLLDAIVILLSRGIDTHLVVVGRTTGWVQPSHGNYRDEAIAWAGAPDLRGRVEFLGWRDDVPAVMQSAVIHCCPSLLDTRESFGLVVLEAKSAGVPSVVFRSGALPELISHKEDGWVCESPTALALADGLAYFLSNADRLAQASRQAHESADRFGWAVFSQAWQRLLLSPRRQSPAAAMSAATSSPRSK